jgi:hypothetical protein
MVSNPRSNPFDVRSAAKFVTAVGLAILSVGVFFVANVIYRNNIARGCKTVVVEATKVVEPPTPKPTPTTRPEFVFPTPIPTYESYKSLPDRYTPTMPPYTRLTKDKWSYESCKPKIKLKSTLPFSIGGPITFVGLTLLVGTKRSKFGQDVAEDI